MTHTEQLSRALRAYDLSGRETPERAAALAAVLSAAHVVCAAPTTRHRIVMPERAVCDTYTPVDIGSKNFKAGFNFGLSEVDRLNPEQEQSLSDKECAAVQLQEPVTGCDIDCGCPYQKARDAKATTNDQ